VKVDSRNLENTFRFEFDQLELDGQMSNAGENSAPIFVVGTPRSGTTLTANILGRHSRIFMPGETHFFDDVYARRKSLGSLPDCGTAEKIFSRLTSMYGRYNEPDDQKRIDRVFSAPGAAEALMGQWKSYKDVFVSFMELQSRHVQKPRWGNNVPRDVFNIPEILTFFPEAKVVVCVRDVRDFLLSYQKKWEVSPLDHQERLQKLYHPILTSLMWKSSMRQLSLVKKLVASRNLAILKYEDLVSDPEREVRRLCKTIGEEFENGMLDVRTHNSSFVRDSENAIFSASVGRWKEKLSVEEACWAHTIAGREMEAVGYGREKLNPSAWRMLGWALTFPGALHRAVSANKEVIGGLGAFLVKRGGALFRNTSMAP